MRFRRFAFLVALLLVPVSALAQQTKVLAPHKPVAPRLPRHREWDPPAVSQSATGALWMIDANFKSTLYLGNMLKEDSLSVTPVLHLSNGAEYTLPPVTLEPSGTAAISINQALADQGIASYATLFGYVEVQYQWGWDAVCGTVWNVDTLHSLIFVDTLRPPPAAAVPHSTNGNPEPAQLSEGMWWKQEKNVTGFVALANVTARPITATVRVLDSANLPLGERAVTVTPHGSKMVELNEVLSASTSTGGLTVTWSGHESELMIAANLKDEAVGYSARLPLGPRPSATAKISQNSYSELGLMSGLADPMMNFPNGTAFTPYSEMRNLSDQPISVTPTLWWMQGGTAHSTQLATFMAAPHHTQTLDVTALMSGAGLKNFNGAVNLVLDTNGPQGALLLSSGSVDQTYTYVFEVIPRGISPSAAKGLPFWSTGNGDDTMITVWNPADEAQDFVFTLFYTGGHYGYPMHLGPRASTSFNVSEVIHSRIPDVEGNLPPLSVQTGSAEISGTQGENQEILVAFDSGIYNVRKATCGTLYCSTCDGEVAAWIDLNPFAVAVGSSTQQTSGYQYNTGTQYNTTSNSSWSSSNTSVATVNAGLTNGVSPGTATLTSTFFQSVPVFDHPCQYVSPPSCPDAWMTPSPQAGGSTVTVSFSPISYVVVGQTATTNATVSQGNTTPISLGITAPAAVVSPPGTFTANTAVVVKGLTVGTATLTATVTNPEGGSPITVGSTSFPVIAIPVNFHQTSAVDAGSGDLRFTYAWSSSSGNPADLSACTVGEIVTYPGSADPFPFPSPPFPPDAYSNPTIIDLAATAGGFQDDHKLTPSTTFVKPYSASSFTGTQYYRFKCSNYNSGNYVNLMGPLSIVRSVSQNSNSTWKFTVTKSGASATINPLP